MYDVLQNGVSTDSHGSTGVAVSHQDQDQEHSSTMMMKQEEDQRERVHKLAHFYRQLRLFTERSTRITNGVGIEVQQYHALVIIKDNSEPGKPLQVNQFATLFSLKSSGATELLERMEKQGLIRRETLSSDGRVRVIHLTGRGETLMSSLANLHYEILRANREQFLADISQFW